MSENGSRKRRKAAIKKTSQSLVRCGKIANGYRQGRGVHTDGAVFQQ